MTRYVLVSYSDVVSLGCILAMLYTAMKTVRATSAAPRNTTWRSAGSAPAPLNKVEVW